MILAIVEAPTMGCAEMVPRILESFTLESSQVSKEPRILNSMAGPGCCRKSDCRINICDPGADAFEHPRKQHSQVSRHTVLHRNAKTTSTTRLRVGSTQVLHDAECETRPASKVSAARCSRKSSADHGPLSPRLR